MGTIITVPIINHGIVLGLPGNERKLVLDCWNKGLVDLAPISHADIRYTLKYIDKQIFGANNLYMAYGDFEPPFAHFSKGLGVDWIEKNIEKFNKFGELYFTDKKKYTLPPYFRDKYFFEKKPRLVHDYSDSVKKYSNEHHLSLEAAYQERQKVVETSLQRKSIHNSEGFYNVDKIEELKAIEKFNQ